MSGRVTERAPAKINLFLHVIGRRADGYHELDSLVVFAETGDVVSGALLPPTKWEKGGAGIAELAVSGPFADALADTPLADNLVLRATEGLAALYREACGQPPPVSLTLEKHLPVAAGLGGGSADAAAALRLLMRIWDFSPAREVLAGLAEKIGADVPACLTGVPMRVGGIGERLEPATVPPLELVLVNPGKPLATAAVFRALDLLAVSGAAPPLPRPVECAALLTFLDTTRNDLAAPAVRLLPEIGSVLEALAALAGCRLARLSGSGPTAFALFTEGKLADDAAVRLAAAHPGWWVCRTRTAGLAKPAVLNGSG